MTDSKPTYLVIGTAKAGTTSLCALLGSHPDVFMSTPKELNFFAYDHLYARGIEWFEGHFRAAGGRRARGEGSPLYTLRRIYPDAAARIAGYDRTLKLIFIARNPITRIEAGWLEMRSWGDERADADFNRALKSSREWLVDSSNYWLELERYREYFPEDQIKVVFFEDLIRDWRGVLSECFTFLGVDPDTEVDGSLAHLNRSADKRVRRTSVSLLRKLPGVERAIAAAKRALPETWRAQIRRHVLDAPASARPRWSAESRRWVVDELQEDTERFLSFYGKRADFWKLSEPSQAPDSTSSGIGSGIMKSPR
jgi:hypothetical protein